MIRALLSVFAAAGPGNHFGPSGAVLSRREPRAENAVRARFQDEGCAAKRRRRRGSRVARRRAGIPQTPGLNTRGHRGRKSNLQASPPRKENARSA